MVPIPACRQCQGRFPVYLPLSVLLCPYPSFDLFSPPFPLHPKVHTFCISDSPLLVGSPNPMQSPFFSFPHPGLLRGPAPSFLSMVDILISCPTFAFPKPRIIHLPPSCLFLQPPGGRPCRRSSVDSPTFIFFFFFFFGYQGFSLPPPTLRCLMTQFTR